MSIYLEQIFNQFILPFGGTPPKFFVVIIIIIFVAWSLIWKGLALWSAARAGDKKWFTVLLIVNTLGILEILYLYVLKKHTEEK